MKSISYIFTALMLAGLALAVGLTIPIVRHMYGVDQTEAFIANAATAFGMAFVLAMLALLTYGLARAFGWSMLKARMKLGLFPLVSAALMLMTSLNPVGFAFLYDAFFASEQLSRNITRPIVLWVFSGSRPF